MPALIPYGRHLVDEADIRAVVDILRDGLLTQGPMVDAFEQAIADYVGAKYAVAVSSGTAGLHLAALAAGLGPGAALVTSPITFVASANAALYVGGRRCLRTSTRRPSTCRPAVWPRCSPPTRRRAW